MEMVLRIALIDADGSLSWSSSASDEYKIDLLLLLLLNASHRD